jgi:rhodanese-related sulfurtransferase
MRREKNLAEAKVALKVVNSMNAFNLLQDLRHLIILDFRSEEEFNQSHIRKAIRVDISDYKEKIAGCIVSLHEKTKPGNTLPE